ncbi:hypothetical protein [Burkholderia stagnalis]|uniref:hypothetical protein n=1 Tax=Burkholderia stagnalis TaxID=1503054 RepID=UPI000758A71C|nr:hypothetical protein [Burkholderia stagnalis]KVM85807.1 hypothetical protein WT05_14430 [Burkholderia stagnalis]KVN28304.1 hypothetical protein WT11_26150 [Burkholderia stagnalis]KVX51701.1 hypothetical protein WT33_31140 [Burkholderia stagnalis]KWH43939.1 hypothetical protein WT61_30095 [Burkholderia stagnalis]KWH54353.1 hypothetical protein WT62_04805 [Burkholderia stagnalis]
MKKLSLSTALAAALVAVSVTGAALASTTLKSFDTPYAATISLDNAARDTSGKRVIAYRIALKSATCQSTLKGTAAFLAKTDAAQDDSAFLRNGDVVKTNVFRGTGPDGEVTITMDVESKAPKYAGVVVKNARVAAGGCIKESEIGFDFF